MAPPNGQNVHIPRGIRPLPPIPFGWRRGSRGEKKLDSRVLLALRQFPRLAGRGCMPRMPCVWVCVKLAGAAQSIFVEHGRTPLSAAAFPLRPSCSFQKVWQSGKDTLPVTQLPFNQRLKLTSTLPTPHKTWQSWQAPPSRKDNSQSSWPLPSTTFWPGDHPAKP
jgi:hypothetical protein